MVIGGARTPYSGQFDERDIPRMFVKFNFISIKIRN
jgi:hypothetical protein